MESGALSTHIRHGILQLTSPCLSVEKAARYPDDLLLLLHTHKPTHLEIPTNGDGWLNLRLQITIHHAANRPTIGQAGLHVIWGSAAETIVNTQVYESIDLQDHASAVRAGGASSTPKQEG